MTEKQERLPSVFQPIGVSTNKLLKLKAGDSIADFVGPLGRPSELVTDDFEEVKKKRVVFIACGVGYCTGISAG